MNIHARTIIRLLKIYSISLIAALLTYFVFTTLSAEQLVATFIISFVVVILWISYDLVKTQISTEDELKKLNDKY